MASDTDLDVSWVIDNKPFVKGMKDAETTADKTAKKIKEGMDKGSASVEKLSKGALKAALAFVGFQTGEAVVGRIIQNSQVLRSVSENLWKSIGEGIDSWLKGFDAVDRYMKSKAWNEKIHKDVDDFRAESRALEEVTESLRDLEDQSEKTIRAASHSQFTETDAPERYAKILQGLSIDFDSLRQSGERLKEDQLFKVIFGQLRVQAEQGKIALALIPALEDNARKAIDTRRAAEDELIKTNAKLIEQDRALAGSGGARLDKLFSAQGTTGSTQLAENLRKKLEEIGFTGEKMRASMSEAFDSSLVKTLTTNLQALRKEYGLTDDQIEAIAAGLKKVQAEGKAAADELAKLQRKQSWDGFNDGVGQALEGMQDMEAVGKEVADGIRGAFADTFKDVVKGTFDARTALSSVLDLLLNVFANLASGQLTAGIGGALGFGGAKAGGGPVSAGTAYLVGEDGPELFRPSGGGSIVPAGETARIMSGSASVNAPITIHVNGAKDPQATGSEVARQVQAAILDLVSRNQSLRRAIGNQ